MRDMSSIRLWLAAALFWGAGCGVSEMGPAEEVSLTVWNRSEFTLEEVRAHSGPSFFDAPNLLDAPLADEGRVEITLMSGGYVTVIRRRVEQIGEKMAFTTERGLELPSDGYVLEVYQQAFRLVPPDVP